MKSLSGRLQQKQCQKHIEYMSLYLQHTVKVHGELKFKLCVDKSADRMIPLQTFPVEAEGFASQMWHDADDLRSHVVVVARDVFGNWKPPHFHFFFLHQLTLLPTNQFHRDRHCLPLRPNLCAFLCLTATSN